MEVRGKITSITRNYDTGMPIVAFELTEEPEGIDAYKDKELTITVRRWFEKRSLDANAYFHVLCRKLREKMRDISFARMKNILIGRYGQPYIIDGQEKTIETDIPLSFMLDQETLHVEPCGITADGLDRYRLMRPTHEYDSREMWLLIQGTIADCKEQGIETDTPEELERLRAIWESG